MQSLPLVANIQHSLPMLDTCRRFPINWRIDLIAALYLRKHPYHVWTHFPILIVLFLLYSFVFLTELLYCYTY
ncbi:hypothetical protein BT96DRAFT_443222 [Gymnopus androsaceus JB14]|uniref:Uncharacterized protein n=1 Tax=Gymnopus androsaceus JB14 TaxID=1447944 RepID=A0A6A4GRR7_9AGAR|nr:hypothetical protein BT96DRAFT_443222 [Gymnopus androsaceus JB14]